MSTTSSRKTRCWSGRARARRRPRRRAGDGTFEPSDVNGERVADDGAAEWMGENLETSRGAMEDQLGTRLDNVFPEDSDQSASERARR